MQAIFWIWNGQAVRVSNVVQNLNHLKIGTGLDYLNTGRVFLANVFLANVFGTRAPTLQVCELT